MAWGKSKGEQSQQPLDDWSNAGDRGNTELADMIQEVADLNRGVRVKVYRREGPRDSRKEHWLATYEEIPSEEWIASQFPQYSQFRIYVHFSDHNGTRQRITKSLDIDPNASCRQGPNAIVPAGGAMGMNDTTNMIQMMMQQQTAAMMEMMKGAFAMIGQALAGQSAGGPDLSAITGQMGDTLAASFQQQQALISQIGRAQVRSITNLPPEPEQPAEHPLLQALRYLVEGFAERILTSTDMGRRFMASQAAKNPEFQATVDMAQQDPAAYAAAWDKLVSEGAITDEQLTTIMQSLRVPTPSELGAVEPKPDYEQMELTLDPESSGEPEDRRPAVDPGFAHSAAG